jgi:uncharacterized surface protein with fasciclin (FAS1) repeats
MWKLLALLWLLITALIAGAALFFLGFFSLAGVQTTIPAPFEDYGLEVAPQAEAPSIVQIAEADGRFTTLTTALSLTGLRETLDSPGSYTVFAPTDEAFAALPAETLDSLLQDLPLLTDILLYHALGMEMDAAAVLLKDELEMLNGQTAIISLGENGEVFINQAQIILTDIRANNGIIHVIDAVLIPTAPAEETDDES